MFGILQRDKRSLTLNWSTIIVFCLSRTFLKILIENRKKESEKLYEKHLSFKGEMANITLMCDHNLTTKMGCSFSTLFAPCIGVSFKVVNVSNIFLKY